MANEQVQKYITAIKKNKETSAIVVIGCLVALVGWIYMQEGSRVEVEIPMVMAGQLDEVLTPENTSAAALFEVDPDIASDGRFAHLVTYGLFTLRPPAEVQQRQQQADQRFLEAQTAFAQQDNATARAICEEILTQIYPPHIPTQALLSDIMEILEPEPTEDAQPDADPFGAGAAVNGGMNDGDLNAGAGTDQGFF